MLRRSHLYSNMDQEAKVHSGAHWKITLISLVLALVSLVSLGMGSQFQGPLTVARQFWAIVGGRELDTASRILYHLRLPRLLLGLLAGAGLALSGTALQAVTRNPLVSPFTLGLSSAASFGASLSIVFGWTLFPGTRMGPVFTAFFMALACAALVFLIAGRSGLIPVTLVLTGLALSYLFSALSASVQFISQEYQLSAVVNWTFGSLNGAQWDQVRILAPLVLLAFPLLFALTWPLNLMASNDDTVVLSLGVRPRLVRFLSGLLAVILTSGIISFTGVIGFLGLVAPHLARMIVGSDHRFLIPYSALIGALLLVLADALGRSLLAPVQIPVGIVVSFLGVPLFLHLILQGRSRGEA